MDDDHDNFPKWPLTTTPPRGHRPPRKSNRARCATSGALGLLRVGEDLDPSAEKRYSPAKIVRMTTEDITGDPNPKYISTSCVEWQKLTMRMSIRPFTRLTNALSKKPENHAAAVALHYMHYTSCRVHQTLRVSQRLKRASRRTYGTSPRSSPCSIWQAKQQRSRSTVVSEWRRRAFSMTAAERYRGGKSDANSGVSKAGWSPRTS